VTYPLDDAILPTASRNGEFQHGDQPRLKKVQISTRAVIQRINRRLKPDLEALKIARTVQAALDCGRY